MISEHDIHFSAVCGYSKSVIEWILIITSRLGTICNGWGVHNSSSPDSGLFRSPTGTYDSDAMYTSTIKLEIASINLVGWKREYMHDIDEMHCSESIHGLSHLGVISKIRIGSRKFEIWCSTF